MFIDQFYQDLVIIFNTFCIQDLLDSFEEGGGDGRFLLSADPELDNCCTGVEGFEDFVFVVAGEDKSAVAMKLLNKRP